MALSRTAAGATLSHVRGGADDAAHRMLCAMRWPDPDGAPVYPNCSCAAVHTYRFRRVFKCKGCYR